MPKLSDQSSERSNNTVRKHHRMLIDGFSNYEDDSLPDYSEFDSESVVLDYRRESRRFVQPARMSAPMTTIETVTITRPLKVIAFICGNIVVILLIMALTSTDWLLSSGWRQGLFTHCIEDLTQPIPFNYEAKEEGCYPSRDVFYIKATAGLCILSLVTDVIATILTGIGLHTKNQNIKYKFYRRAVLIMLVALIAVLVALIMYPLCFSGELSLGNRPIWEFGWAYGVCWGAAIFLFGGVILLLCDKESEEIYFKERKIVHNTQLQT
ncbi:transmembrane protein 47 isoform X1 [Sitodiplosis mosellana]|uniref:transmembrane protein 47 isoform X1 n=2 Tax=Sitodiplosis mosellana TaxID=263140 RepID=UPI00244501D3|nr:transmembrane protein 47 isoform X1 [Sitodiplosis mosellana]